MDGKKAESEAKVMKTLLPSIEVDLGEYGIAHVSPVGVRHLREFSGMIAKMLPIVQASAQKSRIEIEKQIAAKGIKFEDDKQKESAIQRAVGEELFKSLLPTLLDEGLRLIEECTSFDLDGITFDDLPHWAAPEIIEKWWTASFVGEHKGKSKLDPWKAAIKAITDSLPSSQKGETS